MSRHTTQFRNSRNTIRGHALQTNALTRRLLNRTTRTFLITTSGNTHTNTKDIRRSTIGTRRLIRLTYINTRSKRIFYTLTIRINFRLLNTKGTRLTNNGIHLPLHRNNSLHHLTTENYTRIRSILTYLDTRSRQQRRKQRALRMSLTITMSIRIPRIKGLNLKRSRNI